MSLLNSISQLTNDNLSEDQRRLALRQFAQENGWHPSDEILDYRGTAQLASGHLLVEHGLDNSAVITFLSQSSQFTSLPYELQRVFLSLSYNNLVDWHLFPDRGGVLWVYNRSQPFATKYVRLSEVPDAHRADSFDRLVGRKPNPNVPALDDALINTVSRWRRVLAAELKDFSDTSPIAELFNAIFFVRALEDDQHRASLFPSRSLRQTVATEDTPTLRLAIQHSLREVTRQEMPAGLIDFSLLGAFDNLDVSTQLELVTDFYVNRFAPYPYDFSLMSKHALSRIYERYISLLRPVATSQRTFFADDSLVDEGPGKGLGEVYTPQYIARFFARFLEENNTPATFRSMKAIDPACGSGIFLRTLLEAQCDPLKTRDLNSTVNQAFVNVSGMDVEENACKATRLSLTLLHIALVGRFPASPLKIHAANALEAFSDKDENNQEYDAVIANPPYVRWESIPESWQELMKGILLDEMTARPDLYLAFVKVALDAIKPGGFVLLVLPHAFLMADNAKPLRGLIADGYWVRHLVDLSELNVFEHASSYPILLIAERRWFDSSGPSAVITRCSGFAGHALSSALSGQRESTPFYSVHSVPQDYFHAPNWKVLSPQDFSIHRKLASFVPLQDLLEVAQGMNSGCDEVFFVDRSQIPVGEENIYAPLLRDREMLKFRMPESTEKAAFYPYVGDSLIDEQELQGAFPKTWEYLESHYDQLARRASVRRGQLPWWRPERPRQPKEILRPKIVGPHLMLLPKFSVDVEGKFMVSRSPYLYHSQNDEEMLLLILGFLNSSIGHWQIVTQSHRYSRGYARLEASTLKTFRVPTPASVPPRHTASIIDAVNSMRHGELSSKAGESLDAAVASVYGIDLDRLPEITLFESK
jgi:hypothetical protein